MRHVYLILLLPFLVACPGGGSSDSSPAVAAPVASPAIVAPIDTPTPSPTPSPTPVATPTPTPSPTPPPAANLNCYQNGFNSVWCDGGVLGYTATQVNINWQFFAQDNPPSGQSVTVQNVQTDVCANRQIIDSSGNQCNSVASGYKHHMSCMVYNYNVGPTGTICGNYLNTNHNTLEIQ